MSYPKEYAVVDTVSGFVSEMSSTKKDMQEALQEHIEDGSKNTKWVLVTVTPAIRKRFFDN